MDKNIVLKNIEKIKNKKILIIGDVCVDEYVLGEVRRISPEAPVPVLDVETEDLRLGMAANVAQNVHSLGGVPFLVSVVGKDHGAQLLYDLFQKEKLSTEYLVSDAQRPTTRKVRIMAKHHHIVRVDHEMRKYLSPETENSLLEKVEKGLQLCDAVIVEDYAKGVMSPLLLSSIFSLAKKYSKKVLLDPHRTTPSKYYKGVDLLKPNFDEAIELSGLDYDELKENPNKVLEVGQALKKNVEAKELVITRGKDGMTIFSDEGVTQVPTYARQVFDVTGAGDTVIAAIALGQSAGLSLVDSCILANFAAGVVVGKVGCVPCTVKELQEYIFSFSSL